MIMERGNQGYGRAATSIDTIQLMPLLHAQFSCPLGPKLLPEKMRLIMIPLFLPAPCPYSPCTAQHRWERGYTTMLGWDSGTDAEGLPFSSSSPEDTCGYCMQ